MEASNQQLKLLVERNRTAICIYLFSHAAILAAERDCCSISCCFILLRLDQRATAPACGTRPMVE
jgi:hypothetical protein